MNTCRVHGDFGCLDFSSLWPLNRDERALLVFSHCWKVTVYLVPLEFNVHVFFIFSLSLIFPFNISSLGRTTCCCMVLRSWHYERAPCYIVSKAPSTIKMFHRHYVHQHILFHIQRSFIVNRHLFIYLPWDQSRSNFMICSLNFMKV